MKRPQFFDIATGDAHPPEDTAAQAAFLIEQLAIAAELNPAWHLDADVSQYRPVHLTVLERGPARTVILLVCGEWQGVLRLRVDDSGWVSITVEAGGACVFSALADRPYEEVELRTGAAAPFEPSDPPGRMGKRLNWISLAVGHWPGLAELTPETWFQARATP